MEMHRYDIKANGVDEGVDVAKSVGEGKVGGETCNMQHGEVFNV